MVCFSLKRSSLWVVCDLQECIARESSPELTNVKRHMKHELGKDTMTGWLTKRRRTVQDLLNGTDDLTYIDEDIGDLAGWSESHQKEFNFQQNKALKGKIEAYNYGSLLEDEVEDDLLQAVEDAKEKKCKERQRENQSACQGGSCRLENAS